MENEYTDTQMEPEIGDKPPEVTIGSIISTFRERGIVEAVNDEVLGPHTHLVMLLSIVFLIAIIIGLFQLSM